MTDTALSVRDFGAQGDGMADDTQAIQSAINMGIALGRAVFLPTGNYKVTSLSITLTAQPDNCRFDMFGEGRRGAKLTKIDLSTTPIIDLKHTTIPQTANVTLSDFALFGNNRTSNGIDVLGIGSGFFRNLFIRECAVGLRFHGAIACSVDDVLIVGCTDATVWRASSNLVAYSNANTIRNCRLSDNQRFAIDFGQGSNLRVRDCDIESNGVAGNTGTGGIIIRSTVDDEIGYAVLVLDGCWLEANKGRAIQCETQTSGGLFLKIANTNVLSSESGRAFYSAGGGILAIENTMMPSPGDTLEANCSRLSLRNCIVHTLSGTQNFVLVENTTIGSAAVEGTHQRGIWIGGGYGVQLSWSNNLGRYRLAPDTVTGDLTVMAEVGGSGVFKQSLHCDLATGHEYRVGGQKVVGARQAAVPAPTGGATVDTQARTAINAILARLQAHGLIS